MLLLRKALHTFCQYVTLRLKKWAHEATELSSLGCSFLVIFLSFLQTPTAAQTDHYAPQSGTIPLYLPPSLACRLKHAEHNPDTSSLCKWKRKYGRDWTVKSPLSPLSLSLRQERRYSDNNNKDSDDPHRRIIHEPQKQHQRSSVSPKKLTLSAAGWALSKPSRSWVTAWNFHPARRHFPLNGAHLVWGSSASSLRIWESKGLFSNLFEKFAVCHKRHSVAEQDNFVCHLKWYKAPVTAPNRWRICSTSIMRR